MESHQDEKKRNLDPGSQVHPRYSGASPHAIPRSHEAEIELFLGRNQQRTIRYGEDRLMITGQQSLPKDISFCCRPEQWRDNRQPAFRHVKDSTFAMHPSGSKFNDNSPASSFSLAIFS
ncbi:hypothetical protein NC651_038028 [Populus alba x Populus x berolinensis]|nr:hypothetical protein NC651_038028 [Populus alba x Populus x berolinensis]